MDEKRRILDERSRAERSLRLSEFRGEAGGTSDLKYQKNLPEAFTTSLSITVDLQISSNFPMFVE